MARKTASPLSADTRIALLIGKELFLHAEHTATLRAALKEAHGEVDTIRFDGATAAAADVLDECRSFGLMQQHKLVVVDNAEQLIKEATRPLFERYAQAPPEGATLVLRATTWRAGNLDKHIQKVGITIKCEAESPDKARRWAIEQAPARHGVDVEPGAAALLVERLGTDLGRLDMELAKLASALPLPGKGKRPIVTAEQAAELVGITREEEIWAAQDGFLSGDPEEALRTLHTILDRGAKDQAVGVGFVCVDLARKLHMLSRAARQGQSLSGTAGRLRIWPQSRADALIALARRIDPRRAAALLAAAVETDRRNKSGGGDPARNLEVLALRFASASA